MFKWLYKSRYRIKKISYPLFNGGHDSDCYLQCRSFLWPFWQYDGNEGNEDYLRDRMKQCVFKANAKKTTTYFYNADPLPAHIPDEQKDKYFEEKEKGG